MTSPALDATRCPLCAEPNACGPAAGQEHCWCFDVQLSPEALARIPEPALGLVCICANCGCGASEPALKRP